MANTNSLPPPGATLPPRSSGIGTRRRAGPAYEDPPEVHFKFRDPPMQKSIAEWGSYIQFVEDQVKAKVKNDGNIPSLRCATTPSGSGPVRITYKGSKFDDAMIEEVLRKYVKPIRLLRTGESLTQHPSFLRIFKSDTVTFWPHLLVFYNAQITLKHFPKEMDTSLQSPKFANKLFNGDFDKHIKKVLEANVEILAFIGPYMKEIAKILKAAEEKPVAISSFVSEYGLFHSTAGIVYMSHGKFFYGVYDPIFFTRAGQSYVWPAISTYLIVKLVAESLGVDITLLNLSGYCFKSKKGIHCPQYLINAEYCLYYSMYFLYLWAKAGAPKSSGGLRRVVDDSFIVRPAELRRDPCIASKRFRLVSMGFILSVILIALETPDLLINVSSVDQSVQADGFDLIHPDLRGLIPKFEFLKPLGGGGRRRTRRLGNRKRE
jgi:hypothetical protein